MRTESANHEILKLPPHWRKRLFWARATLFAAVFLAGIGLVSAILFPTLTASFDFLNPNSSRNTLIAPRNEDGSENKNGKIGSGARISFGAAAQEPFSRAIVKIELEKEAAPIGAAELKVRKTYQALLYDQGSPALLRSGTIAEHDGIYYFVSQGKLRPFSSLEIAEKYGYGKDSFVRLEKEEFALHPQGEPINDSRFPLEGQLLRIGEDYYRYGEGKLVRFVSEKAFLSLHDPSQAALADEVFLQKYAVSEDLLGFADGTLISDSEAVYVISANQRLPIDNVLTFQSLGYSWEDVLAASGEEAGIYEKGKLFTARSPHPDGSVLCDKERQKCYLVEKRSLRPLEGKNIRAQYLRKNPVTVDFRSLTESADCTLSSSWLSRRTLECTLSTGNIENLPGNAYMFDLGTSSDGEAKKISVTLTRPKNTETAKMSLSLIKRRALDGYAPGK